MNINDLITLAPGVFKFVGDILKAHKKAKKNGEEKQFVEAVRSGDIDSINRWLHRK